jgi:hypothetical protein
MRRLQQFMRPHQSLLDQLTARPAAESVYRTLLDRPVRQTGKPILQRTGMLTWLATRPPLGHYRVETSPDGGSILYRFTPAIRALIRRPTGALAVPLAKGHRSGKEAPTQSRGLLGFEVAR